MTDTELINAALDRWEDGNDAGLDIPAEELSRDRPHLAGRVALRIERLRRAGWLQKPAGGSPRSEVSSQFDEGDVIDGRFRLSRRLAHGAHGEVWRGTDLVTRREVAVKVPRSGPLPAGGAPLEAEARHASQVRHRNIVPVYFTGRDGDTYYLVLQLIEGESLATCLARAQLSVPAAVRIAREIAGALAHAHARRLVHRDLKPDNVLLDTAGRVYLTDFGIALAAADAGRGAAHGTGTPLYMAPEQLSAGAPLDGRCDVYALGLILFEMLAGRLPFEDGAPAKRSRQQPPRVTAFNPAVPEAIAEAVHTCLAPEPAHRFASAADLLTALGGDPATAGLQPAEEFREASWEARLRYLDVLSTVRPIPVAYWEPVVELLKSSHPADRKRVEGFVLRSGTAAVPALLAALQKALGDLDYRAAILNLLLMTAPRSPAFLAVVKELGLERAVARGFPQVARVRRAVLFVGAAAALGSAVWLATLGITFDLRPPSLEQVRPARAVFALVAGCLAIGLVATRRRGALLALLLVVVLGGVLEFGLLTAVETALHSTTDAINHALQRPGR